MQHMYNWHHEVKKINIQKIYRKTIMIKARNLTSTSKNLLLANVLCHVEINKMNTIKVYFEKAKYLR